MLNYRHKTPTSLVSSVPRPRKPEIKLPPGVNKVTVKGKPYLYLHHGRGTDRASKPVRLPDDPSSAEFWTAYYGATGIAAPKQPAKSVKLLIEAYKDSPEWKQLGDGTRGNWELHLKRIDAAWGDLEVKGLAPKHVLALRDSYADTPAAANNLLRCLSSMLSWSVPREWRDDNPCLHVPKLKGGDGYDPWPWDMIELVRDKGQAWMWQATALALYSGQREGDCLDMTWRKIRNGCIDVKQEKTNLDMLIPLHHDLMAVLETIPKCSTRILTSTRGTPWTKDGFKSSWHKAIRGTEANPSPLRAIADAGLVFHGLRKSAVVMLLEAGATEAEVQAVTGQSPKMIAHYARKVNKAKLAAAAILKWERARPAR